MALNTTDTWPVQINNEELPYTNRFTYLGSIISRDGGTGKARNALGMINNMARIHVQYSYKAKTLSQLGLHNSPVWFRVLVLNGEEFIKTLHISHQEPPAYPADLLS